MWFLPGPRDHGGVAVPVDDPIVAVAAVEPIVAAAAIDVVVAVAADQPVVAGVPEEVIVAAPAGDPVVATPTVDQVAAAAPMDASADADCAASVAGGRRADPAGEHRAGAELVVAVTADQQLVPSERQVTRSGRHRGASSKEARLQCCTPSWIQQHDPPPAPPYRALR